jgi:hypothetical protein
MHHETRKFYSINRVNKCTTHNAYTALGFELRASHLLGRSSYCLSHTANPNWINLKITLIHFIELHDMHSRGLLILALQKKIFQNSIKGQMRVLLFIILSQI